MPSQTPPWPQPSHPSIQKVVHSPTSSPDEFATKSYSTITVPPHGVYTVLGFPPCRLLDESDGGKSYATVQVGPDSHIDLGCDILYVNHSCDPSLVFNTSQALQSASPSSSPSPASNDSSSNSDSTPTPTPNITLLAGPRGLAPGDELTFFYPSTEWDMAQGFDCYCGSEHCLGMVEGAKKLSRAQLEGEKFKEGGKRWIAPHIRGLVGERDGVEWVVDGEREKVKAR